MERVSAHRAKRPMRCYSVVCLGLAAMAEKKSKDLFKANLNALIDQAKRALSKEEARKTWTQAAFAERMQVSESTASRWLHGESLPHAEELDRLAEMFKVPVMRFFADPDAAPTSVMTPEQAIEVLSKLGSAPARVRSPPTHRPKHDEL